MVTITDKNGNSKRLIYNQHVLMLDRFDALSFAIRDEIVSIELVLNINFSDEGKELSTSGSVSDDGKILSMTLYKWNTSASAELSNPIELSSTVTDKKIFIKFATTANIESSFRHFHLTVWAEN